MVSAADASAKVTVPGPLSWDHVRIWAWPVPLLPIVDSRMMPTLAGMLMEFDAGLSMPSTVAAGTTVMVRTASSKSPPPSVARMLKVLMPTSLAVGVPDRFPSGAMVSQAGPEVLV